MPFLCTCAVFLPTQQGRRRGVERVRERAEARPVAFGGTTSEFLPRCHWRSLRTDASVCRLLRYSAALSARRKSRVGEPGWWMSPPPPRPHSSKNPQREQMASGVQKLTSISVPAKLIVPMAPSCAALKQSVILLFKSSRCVKLHFARGKKKIQHYLGLQSNARMLRCLAGRLSADCWQSKRTAVSPVRGTNIDMLQWPTMLIKYMLIEIQWQLEFRRELRGCVEGLVAGVFSLPQECKT